MFALLPALARAEAAAAPTADEIVRRLQARYEETAVLSAHFKQEIRSATLGEELVSHGKVYFRKPGKMRWEFVSPEPKEVISDGRTLWVYEPRQRQVLKAPLERAFRSRTPLAFLLGVGRLEHDFDISLVEQGEEGYLLRLRPREREAASADFLDLRVDSQTYDIVQFQVHDPMGTVTRVRFSGIDRAPALDDGLFRFEVPEGVDVVDLARQTEAGGSVPDPGVDR